VILTLDNLPYYRRVPKDYEANVRYRKAVTARGYESSSAAEELWIACKRDPLFWINTFVFTFDPRRESSRQPFVTYGFQDQIFADVFNCIGHHDGIWPKSRDMGLTWICLLGIAHFFQFADEKSFMLASRKEALVDKTDDPDSLMWKLDYLFEKQPKWLRPVYNRANLHFGNPRNGCVIDGESTNGDLGRGGRRTAHLLDELAAVKNAYEVLRATRDNTPCRLMPSTPKGAGNAFFDISHDSERFVRKVHWINHPRKAEGLYHDAAGKPRSPWYDGECKRAGSVQEIAQELDIDFHGSDFSFFDPDMVADLLENTAHPPWLTGNLEFDNITAEPKRFVAHPDGMVKLWVNLYADRPPVGHDIAFGCDIALGTKDPSGTGASNSTIVGTDLVTGDQVLALAVNGVQPGDFARIVVALARWFRVPGEEGALIVPEANGAGGMFIDSVATLGYHRMYMRQKEDDKSRHKRMLQVPGWWSSPTTKRSLLLQLAEALMLRTFIMRDRAAIEELRYYRHEKGDKVSHSRAEDAEDPSQARESHGDRVIGAALANLCLQRDLGNDTTGTDGSTSGLSVLSMAGRQAARSAAQRLASGRSWTQRPGIRSGSNGQRSHSHSEHLR